MDLDSLKVWSEKLALLLSDPHPGLFTWDGAVGDHMKFFVDEWYKSAPEGSRMMCPNELREIVMGSWVAGWYNGQNVGPLTDNGKRECWAKVAKRLGLQED